MPYEVLVKLEFTTPCLGNERHDDPEPNRMLRNGSGGLIFLQSWWQGCTAAAADRFSKHQKRIRAVKWSSDVDGVTTLIDRFYNRRDGSKHIKKHEGFDTGAIIGVRALVPDDVPIDDLHGILQIAGEYFGISPYGWRRGYGRFSVLEVEKIYGRSAAKNKGEHAGRVSDGSPDHQSAIADNDVQAEGGRCGRQGQDGGSAAVSDR